MANESVQDIEDVIMTVIEAIVDFPEQVKVVCDSSEKSFNYEVSVHADDVGKIIGKEGRVANALRVLVRTLGAKHKVRVMLTIQNRAGHTAPSKPAPNRPQQTGQR